MFTQTFKLNDDIHRIGNLITMQATYLLNLILTVIVSQDTVSVLGRDKGYTVKHNPLPERFPEGKAQRKC